MSWRDGLISAGYDNTARRQRSWELIHHPSKLGGEKKEEKLSIRSNITTLHSFSGVNFSIYKEACLQLESVLILTDDGNDFSTTVKCKWEMMKKFNRNIIIAVSSQPQLAIDCYSLYQIYSSFIVCFLSNESSMLWCWGMQQEINPVIYIFYLFFFFFLVMEPSNGFISSGWM